MHNPELTQTNHSPPGNVATGVVSRRALLRAAAWTLPAVAVGTPALTASGPDGEEPPDHDTPRWYWSQFQVGSTGNRSIQIFTQVNIQNYGALVPFTAFITIRFESYLDEQMTQLFRDHTATFTHTFAGTNGETTPTGKIGFDRFLDAADWPPPGGTLWVRFTMLSVLGIDAANNEFFVPVSTMSQPNSSVGNCYINSW